LSTKIRISPSFNRTTFLKETWQKKPKLLKGFIEHHGALISQDELAGLACEEFLDARIIEHKENTETGSFWRLQNGPFQESDFAEMPKNNWTLLVQSVDQVNEKIFELQTLFDFIPRWRIDDTMVSFATPGGGVGPHFDNYDVFLIQGKGSRKWRIGQHCGCDSLLASDTNLSILADFQTAEEFLVEEGDALYIPPKFSHWGTSINDSVCYSVGFRAPSMVEMLQGFTDFLAENINIEERLVNRGEKIPENISEISNDDLSESYLRIKGMVDNKSHFLTWFGCHMTQPKYPNLVEASNDNCDKKIENGSTLKRSPHSRFAYSYGDNNEIMLFADGEAFIFDRLHERSIKSICEASRIEISKLEGYLDSDNIRETITLLCDCGSLLIE